MDALPDRLAVFDLDGTLLDGDSDDQWLGFLLEEGVLDRATFGALNASIQARYARGEVSGEEFCGFYVSLLAGRARAELEPLRERYTRERILPWIPEAARALVRRHQERGDLVVMHTATNRFVVELSAASFGIAHLIATEPEEEDGRFTGRCAGEVNFGTGKVRRLDEWLAVRGAHLARFSEAWFYSDSRNDIPLLERVGRPVAVDPDEGLAARAQARGWPIVRLDRTGRPT